MTTENLSVHVLIYGAACILEQGTERPPVHILIYGAVCILELDTGALMETLKIAGIFLSIALNMWSARGYDLSS